MEWIRYLKDAFRGKPAPHAETHYLEGADPLAVGTPVGLANSNVRGASRGFLNAGAQFKRDVRVRLNGAEVATRNSLDFLDSPDVVWGVADDGAGDAVEVTAALEVGVLQREQGQLAASPGTTMYTCPGGMVAEIKEITLTNENAATVNVTVFLKVSAGTRRKITTLNRPMATGESFTVGAGHVLEAGDTIEGEASVANDVDYWVSVKETAT